MLVSKQQRISVKGGNREKGEWIGSDRSMDKDSRKSIINERVQGTE